MENRTVDVAIIGGGVMGPSVAYHLLSQGLCQSVALFEQDPMHMHSSTGLSAGGIRHLFSSAVNIALATFSVRFYEQFAQHMATEAGPGPDVAFRRNGYLFLLDRQNEESLLRRADFQEREGVELERLDRAALKDRFPEIEVGDLQGGVFGVRDGFLDPYQVMRGFTQKAQELGAQFITERAEAVEVEAGCAVAVRSAGWRVAARLAVVNAAGAWAGDVGRMAGVEVPVVPRSRQVYQVIPPSAAFDRYPLTIDPTGFYFRPETGGRVLVGKSFDDDPRDFVWDWKRNLFLDAIWPDLAARVPVMENLRLESGWAGLYEVTPDDNAIIGPHPDLERFYVIAGFSGHGMMQGPAAGLALAERICLGSYRSVDASGLELRRFAEGREYREDAIV